MTTTPAPDPVEEGRWSATGMDPRASHVAGGTRATITGTFPTWVPVYVWFGDAAVVRAETSADSLVLTTPSVIAPMVVDVIVRFRTSTSVEMTLVDAFTYHATSSNPVGGTPTTVAEGGSDGVTSPTSPSSSTPSTLPSGPSTTLPTATATPTTSTPTTSTVPSTTMSSTPTTTTPPTDWVRSRGTLTLRAVSPTSSLGGLSASRWPSAGCTATCTGTTL